jgi:hypothetical protein
MSHNKGKFDTIYVPETAEFNQTWHGLHTTVKGKIAMDGSNVPNVFPNIIESRFSLADVDNSRLLLGAMDDESDETPLDGWKMILAEHEKGLIPLHVPKSSYQIHQNKDLFVSLCEAGSIVCGKDNVEIATAGTLGNCSQFFVSIAIKGMDTFEIKGKRANQLHKVFFNLVSSHNGMTASAILLSIIRIVCQNTVNASLNDAETNGTASKFKHSKESLAKITPQAFEASLKQWIAAMQSYKSTLQAFESVKMNMDNFRSFAAGVFTNDGSDSLSTKSFNRIEEMESLFKAGKGNYGETLADGINAFTEYFTSGNGVGKASNPGKRVASANFGRGNDWKRLAIAIASNDSDFATTCKRGEMFYADKLKDIAVKN